MTSLDSMSDADFHNARARSFFLRVLSALSGHSRDLMAFEDVRESLHLGGPVYRGVKSVRVGQIVGSVDRYRDFDRLFLPTQSRTIDRWTRINRAWYQDVSLPPVMLYKVGEVYFVIDGNHRVSVARSRGQEYIDAEVRECAARVPVTADLRPEDLERLHDRLEFLERTRLDEVRPGAVVETTILGGYERLIEHIAVHRYFMGIERKAAIREPEAVAHWYDDIYLPVVAVVEQSGILDELPGRTATDVYLWVMDHLHFLRRTPGQESARPEEAAKDFIEGVYDGTLDDIA
jgi:hypothetical protein